MIAAGAAALQSRRSVLDFLDGYAVAAYDSEVGITVTGSGVSAQDDLKGTRDLLQGTDAQRTPYTSAGAQSYYTSNGTQALACTAAADLTGAGICLIAVLKLNAAVLGRNFFTLGSGGTARTGLKIDTVVSNFAGQVTDSIGNDVIVGPATDLVTHCQVLLNDVGVSRKLYIDGGAGTSGVRTTALSGAHTVVTSLGRGNPISNAVQGQAYLEAVCKPPPPLSVLNIFGAYSAARFGHLWTPAT